MLGSPKLLALAALVLPLFTSASPIHSNQTKRDANLGFPYGQQKVRGVNLGGWLVLEPWITTYLFDPLPASIVDEYTFCQNQDRGTAERALRNHWNTFITEDDFRQIAAAGLNHVRLPIGFWAFDVSGGEPYIQGQKDYLYRAIGWARNHGLHVQIDLHGAPGSQNGFDNSGRRGSALWATQQSNLARTKTVLLNLAKEFSDPQYYGTVTSLEILNEPAGYMNDQLKNTARSFSNDLYYTIRYPYGSSQESGLLVTYHDAFMPASFWKGLFTYPKVNGIAVDMHHYEIFSEAELRRTYSQHLSSMCAFGNDIAAFDTWQIVGEWTPTVYDCARHLNGRGIGARYDGSYPGSTRQGDCRPFTGDGSTFPDYYKSFLRDSWDTQTQVAETRGIGWIQWTWKASAAEWSYQAGLAGGWIPRDPSNHRGFKCS